MVALECPVCQRRLSVPDQLSGRPAKCPHCGQVFLVPAVGPASAAGTPAAQASDRAPLGSASAGQEQWHLKTPAGQTYGPVPRSELDAWVAEGRVTPESQLLRHGTHQWQWASDIYPLLRSAQASPSQAGLAAGTSPSGRIEGESGKTSPRVDPADYLRRRKLGSEVYGIVGMVLGILCVLACLPGCLLSPLLIAFPPLLVGGLLLLMIVSIIGLILGISGRGGFKVAAIVLNLVVLVPSVVLLIVVLLAGLAVLRMQAGP